MRYLRRTVCRPRRMPNFQANGPPFEVRASRKGTLPWLRRLPLSVRPAPPPRTWARSPSPARWAPSSNGTISSIYGTAAALVFNNLFFPTIDPAGRHVGGIGDLCGGLRGAAGGRRVFGHFGDRIGRKVDADAHHVDHGPGHVPDRPAADLRADRHLGAGPAGRLRFIQGIGAGRRMGRRSLMVVEHAPTDRRGFYGSLVQIGFPLGLVTSSGVFAIVTLLPEDQFMAWGWRIPFLISIVLVASALHARRYPKRRCSRRSRRSRISPAIPSTRRSSKSPARLPGGARVKNLRSVVGLHADGVRRRLRHDQLACRAPCCSTRFSGPPWSRS